MGRSRVMSFMSAFGGPPRSPPSATPPAAQARHQETASPLPLQTAAEVGRDSPTPKARQERSQSMRPASMIGGYQPPLMEIAHDTIPELAPIFTFLNSHSNKLYQEGYFLKLNDLDSRGRPYGDRSWVECFAQLVGTVLSLWDAAALDAAGQDGEVAPTFINLADASIKMIETLPTRSQDVQPLANVLSISTAGKNRYLFHFSNVNALTQWTAGIRLAMYEHATLQEAYTGALIAGKGKLLNNIKVIMDRTKLSSEEWCRVRFGAGTPWRRCWYVITPPDEKEVQKQAKAFKKKSAYDRQVPVLKGDIKFYDTKKTKKTTPIATIKDAYSAYAIYPQSKPLIDQSTLIKLEGIITIHSQPEAMTEGFIFVMPEVHPAVTGFEMMLRFLFPVYDIFGLYGRPARLIADTLDTRSLMFAMPQEKRYGYLEIFDVATLIHTDGSQQWNEREWRKQLKMLTSQRISKMQASGSRPGSVLGGRRSHRNSLPPRTEQLRFQDGAPMRSTPSLHRDIGGFAPPQHTGSAPPESSLSHQRAASESTPFSTPRRQRTLQEGPTNYTPSRLSYEANNQPPYEANNQSQTSFEVIAPPPPAHGVPAAPYRNPQVQRYAGDVDGANERSSSESERRYRNAGEGEMHAQNIQQGLLPNAPPAPVATPPAFAHQPGAVPQTRPYHSPELRRANSRMSSTTLSQLAAAGNAVGAGANANTASGIAAAGAAAAWRSNSPQKEGRHSEDQGSRGVIDNRNARTNSPLADHTFANEGMGLTGTYNPTSNALRPLPSSLDPTPPYSSDYNSESSLSQQRSFLAPSPSPTHPRSPSPLSNSTTYPTIQPAQELPAAPAAQNFSRIVPQNTQTPATNGSASERPQSVVIAPTVIPGRSEQLQRQETSRSISRKPLPSPSRPEASGKPISQRSFEDTSASRPRTGSDNSSNYDNDSIDSPDYASTRKSTDTRRSGATVEKPRTGVLKTVGTVDPADKEVVIGDVRYRPDPGQQPVNNKIPEIDFGPTQIMKTQGRPSTSPQASYQGNGQQGGYGRSSPNQQYNKSPNRKPVTPEPYAYRPSSAASDETRRNVAWQPGATAGSGSPGNRQSITPEQFVQQRAAANRAVPVYAHGRKQSGTPPHGSRQSSVDWSAQNIRQETPPQPNSRGASTIMNPSTDYSARLSAREQEHVARVTGSPLINMAGKDVPRPTVQGGGLVGAIEAREQEKKAIKQGVSGQMVQHAIAQRQQHAQAEAQGYQNQNNQYPQPSPQMHVPGQFPQTPQGAYGNWGNQQYPQNQQYAYQPQSAHPAAHVYWQGTQYVQDQAQARYQGQYRQGQNQQGQQQQYNPYFDDQQGQLR
ncbi:hypothetical protein MMC30_000099 [Trapelia coarctata]|nr:hypothetical protein [Trapelia coarctata]